MLDKCLLSIHFYISVIVLVIVSYVLIEVWSTVNDSLLHGLDLTTLLFLALALRYLLVQCHFILVLHESLNLLLGVHDRLHISLVKELIIVLLLWFALLILTVLHHYILLGTLMSSILLLILRMILGLNRLVSRVCGNGIKLLIKTNLV